MPTKSSDIWRQLGVINPIKEAKIEELKGWNFFNSGHVLGEAEPIFPRLEIPVIEEKKDELSINEELVIENSIEIGDFDKIKIEVVEILAVEKVKGADKLLKFKVKLKDGIRQIISGIAKSYPEQEILVGEKVLAIINLKPVKLRGEISQGMFLTVENKKNGSKLIQVDSKVELGARIK